MEKVGEFIGGLEKIPGIKQLYLACDYAFNGAMYLAGKIHPRFEEFLREHQGLITLSFGFGSSYLAVRGFEKVFRKYDNILHYLEKVGYGINMGIPIAIEIFNPGGLQGLVENNPVFSWGLIGLECGSTIAAIQEGHKRRLRKIYKNLIA